MAFQKLDFRGQVKLLTTMAHEAITSFPICVKKIEFINHGENATFRIIDKNGVQCLLRLHRTNYHTQEAILEELKWLRALNQSKKINCQVPIASKAGNLLVSVTIEDHIRYCDLLNWKSGKIRRHNHSLESFYKLGHLTATFGSPFALKGGLSKYSTFIQCRDMACEALSSFEKKFPQKMGVIHADLHFGNLVWNKGEAIPIFKQVLKSGPHFNWLPL